MQISNLQGLQECLNCHQKRNFSNFRKYTSCKKIFSQINLIWNPSPGFLELFVITNLNKIKINKINNLNNGLLF